MLTSQTNRIQQAVEKLLTYNRIPFINDFLRKQRIPVGTSMPLLAQILPEALQGTSQIYSVTIEDLIQHLDKLQEHGAQQVFLFRRPDSLSEDRLQLLRKEEHVREMLAQKQLSHLFNSNQYIWDANPPQLAEVRHDAKMLVCKWVETRSWLTQQFQQKPLSKEERSVNFFRLNLLTGDSELLIQKLNPTPEKKLREEMDLYLVLVKDLFGLDAMVSVLLEPAMRRILSGRDFHIRTWAIARPGETLRRTGDPKLVQTLLLKFFSFVPLRVTYLHPNSHIGVRMDGRKDVLEISVPCVPQQHDEILTQIRRMASEQIKDPDLRKIADLHPQWKAAIKKIDLRITDLKQMRIRSHQLVEQEWRDRKQVTTAMEEAQKTNPLRFRACYYVRDPETGAPLRPEYDTVASIPEQANIQRDGKIEKVPTAGNVWVTLLVERPAMPMAPKQILTDALIGKLGQTAGQFALFPILFVFTVAYLLLLVWINRLMIVDLVLPFPTARFLVYPLFPLLWIVMAALYIFLVSQKYFEAAVKTYQQLIGKSQKPGSKSSDEARGSSQSESGSENEEETECYDETANEEQAPQDSA